MRLFFVERGSIIHSTPFFAAVNCLLKTSQPSKGLCPIFYISEKETVNTTTYDNSQMQVGAAYDNSYSGVSTSQHHYQVYIIASCFD